MSNKIQNPPRTIFFGTPNFAVSALKKLIESGYSITAVVTQPDKKAGRSNKIISGPVKLIAQTYGLQIFQPSSLNDEKFFEVFKSLQPELCIVSAYGKIIPQKYIDLPRLGIINIHPSLLPKYRGPSPIQTAIINGENETGVSIMLIDNQMDHGPILASQNIAIKSDGTFTEIEPMLAELGAKLLVSTLPDWISGRIKPLGQNHSRATYTKLLTRSDGRINWQRPTDEIYNQIRALNPEPGTWSVFENKILNIMKAKPFNKMEQALPPGTVIKNDSSIIVSGSDGFLEIHELQLQGSRPMSPQSFSNGHRNFIGSNLG